MRNLRGTYVHRGDASRQRRLIEQGVFVAGAVVGTLVAVGSRRTIPASAAPVDAVVTESHSPFAAFGETRKLRAELEAAKGELMTVKGRYDRADKVIQYSTKYGINAGLAGKVFDASTREGLDPELTFRVVNAESQFNERAVSKAGAVGLTQLMPNTAKLYDERVGRDQLLDARTNLRVGFRYLRTLIDMYHGNVRLAVLAYNRGEDAVWRDIHAGVNPGNGYDLYVLKNYKGTGLIQ
jgi:soluble lytic murein transglycosylase-like protein